MCVQYETRVYQNREGVREREEEGGREELGTEGGGDGGRR